MSEEDRPYRPSLGIRLRCQEVSRLISEGMDRDLPASDRARLRLHFVICEACRRTQGQFRLMRDAVRSLERDRAGEGAGAAESSAKG
jgi:Putative zinc-finger